MGIGAGRSRNVHSMAQHIRRVALVVRDYDEAIRYYVDKLGFRLVEDTYIEAQDKRWVLVAPPGASECHLLLARAADHEQASRIGNQAGGRVFLFLHTDDFRRDYDAYRSRGVVFVREPRQEPYGTVAVFEDLYGNLWDLIEPTKSGARHQFRAGFPPSRE
jgi:catechol 2,3-dioxygenase-like lactoylglutathione lyase family enzyme